MRYLRRTRRLQEGRCQSKFYTACLRIRMGQSSTVFAHESPTRSAGFDAENGLYLFALTVPRKVLTQELRDVATSSPTFDRDLAVKIGKCMTVRRNFCRLSTQQLGARLGIDSMEVEAYEQGEKRMSCRLLLETAKQLKATPRFLFHLA